MATHGRLSGCAIVCVSYNLQCRYLLVFHIKVLFCCKYRYVESNVAAVWPWEDVAVLDKTDPHHSSQRPEVWAWQIKVPFRVNSSRIWIWLSSFSDYVSWRCSGVAMLSRPSKLHASSSAVLTPGWLTACCVCFLFCPFKWLKGIFCLQFCCFMNTTSYR